MWGIIGRLFVNEAAKKADKEQRRKNKHGNLWECEDGLTYQVKPCDDKPFTIWAEEDTEIEIQVDWVNQKLLIKAERDD